MKFLAALAPLLLSVAGQIITALGITAVTYVGFDLVVSNFKREITNSIVNSGVPVGLLQMFYISGGGVILNIFFGAFTFVVAFKSMTKLAPRFKK